MPLPGISESDSHVKADLNSLLQMFALSSVSVFKIPFSLSVLIPNASFLRDLTNDQIFSPSRFFLGSREQGFPSQKRIYWNMLPKCASSVF